MIQRESLVFSRCCRRMTKPFGSPSSWTVVRETMSLSMYSDTVLPARAHDLL